jgi:hypothetical protein
MTMEYGTITGRLVAAVADTLDDTDANPDIVPITGTVTFTPRVDRIVVASESVTVVPSPITASLDEQGYVSRNGVRSVTLLASDSRFYNPNGWTYRVSFDQLAANGRRITFDSYSINVPANATIDLSSVTPVTTSSGDAVVRGPIGPVGPQGPQGDPGPSDSQVATYFASPTSTRAAADNRYSKGRTAVRTPLKFSDTTLNAFNSVGITKSATMMSATTPGTEGRFWVPLWQGNAFRASGSILVSKATSGSLSMFGLSGSAAGVDPGTSTDWVGVAYVQGTGIVIRRKLAPGNDVVLMADSALTDGQRYTVGLVFDGTMHATGAPGEFIVQGVINNADGSSLSTGTFYSVSAYYNGTGAFVARTNVANGIDDVQMTQVLGGDIATPTGILQGAYYAGTPAERMSMRIPARPNGKLVIAVHGRGDGAFTQYNANQYNQTWRLLLAAGYTIAMPDMGGDLWGTQAAQDYLARCRDVVCAAFNLDRKVFLWGGSMGGGASLTAISRGTFGPEGVAAAYLAQPVCDVAAVYADNSATFTEIPGLYPNDATYAAYSPIRRDPATFAGVPLLFLASPQDPVVVKSKNTDAMRTRLGNVTRHSLITVTGIHGDPSEFQADACLSWFQSAV